MKALLQASRTLVSPCVYKPVHFHALNKLWLHPYLLQRWLHIHTSLQHLAHTYAFLAEHNWQKGLHRSHQLALHFAVCLVRC